MLGKLVLILTLLGGANALRGQESGIQVSNSFTARGGVTRSDQWPRGSAEFFWRPELFGEYFPRPDLRFSAELCLDNRLELLWSDSDFRPDLRFEPYRAWAAASWKNTELKAGLQHIRMGVAQIYRPLQWFDDLVPGAFLQDSQGVMAINFSHFFPNPELRVWALPGTGEKLGTQVYATPKGTWEYGGRVGVSSFLGETGLSFDLRETDLYAAESLPVRDYRIGLDQRVDGFMGGWLEAELSVLDDDIWWSGQGNNPLNRYYSGAATLGGDYTFGLGNGLYTLAEFNLLWSLPDNVGARDFGRPETKWRSALMFNYPLGLLDTLVLLGSCNADLLGGYSASLAWRRVYDKLSWDLSLGYHHAGKPGQSGSEAIALTINYDI